MVKQVGKLIEKKVKDNNRVQNTVASLELWAKRPGKRERPAHLTPDKIKNFFTLRNKDLFGKKYVPLRKKV